MSCKKCGNSNTNCGCKDTAYTTVKTYTCPPDTACPAPLKCSEFFDAACVYMTDGIADAGILPGSSLESIIQQLIMLVTNPGCVDAPGGVPGGGTVTFVNAVWPGNAITIAGGPIQNSGTFVFNGNGNSSQYIDGQGNLQSFPIIPSAIEFRTDGTPNGAQDLLNLVAGQGIVLTESNGSVTIEADSVTYSVRNGLSEQPTDSGIFELGAPSSPGAPLIHDTYIAGSQYAFEVTNTASTYLQGNRIDIEGADPGVMILSTGGASDNSVEVTGTQTAIQSSGGAGATKILLDPSKIKIQTPLYATKDNDNVLTLIDKTTGEVEFMPISAITLQVNGTDNGDQTLLNLLDGNGITITDDGVGGVTIDGVLLQTNGADNSTQTLLNLVEGPGITLTEAAGSVTIEAAAPGINLTTTGTSGASTYNTNTGDLNIPVYQTQVLVKDEGSNLVANPSSINFVGTAVTTTASGTDVTVTITGGGPGAVDADNGLILDTTNPALPLVQLGGPSTTPAPLVRDTYILTSTPIAEFDFDISGSRATKPIINVSNSGQGSAVKGQTVGGYAIYGTTASGFSGYFEADSSLIGLYSVNKTGNLAAEFESVSSVNNTVIPVVRVMRTVNISSPGVNGADGIGASVDFFLEDDNNVAAQAGAISYEFTDAATTATVSQFAISTADAGTLSRKLEITGAGQLILNEYTTSSSFDPESGTSVGVLNVDATGKVFVAGGAGFEAQVNSTLASSTVLNLLDSADITVQDLGGGDVSFVLNNPGQTYTVNNGLSPQTTPSANPNNFQLGGQLVKDTTILSTSGHKLNIESSVSGSPQGALNVNGFSNRAIYAQGSSSTQSAVGIVNTGSAAALDVQNDSTGIGVVINAANNYAITARINANTNPFLPVAGFTVVAASTNAVYRGIEIVRSTGGTAANGIGTSIGMFSQTNNPSTLSNAGNILTSKLYAVNASAPISQFEISGVGGSSTYQTQFTILGGGTSALGSLISGQIKFDRYAAGTIYKPANDIVAAAGFNLGIDADGNIWATDFSTSTGPVTGVSSIGIGTLTNGATATVSNPSGPAATINITGQNAYTIISGDTAGTATAGAYNSEFKVTGSQGITTEVAEGSPDTITVKGPAKYFTVQTQTSAGAQVGLYTPAAWNSQLKIKAGNGISITDGGAGLDTIIISSTGGGPTGGTVTNVSGTNANGFTLSITNPTTTPNITIGTSVTGILVGDGSGGITNVSTSGGSGVLTYNSVTNTYSYTTLPTVNNGAIVVGATAALGTGLTVALQNSAGGAFTANKADSSTYRVSVGPALTDYATKMSPALPGGSLPQYVTKTASDVITLATPVTTFSPGTTGFTVSNGVATNVTTPLTGPVVLGGVLGVTSGGTGNTTAPGSGQLLVGDGAGGFTVTTISGSGGISVTSGPGGINITGTGVTPSFLNGLYVNTDGSIRLGSGLATAPTVTGNLIEETVVRMNSQLFRLSDGTDAGVLDLGFDVNDATAVKRAYLGTPTEGFWFSATTAGAAAPSANFQGFVFAGQTTNAIPTTINGFLHRPIGAAAFPASFNGFANDVPGARLVMGYLGTNVYQVINRTSNVINQHGLWGGTGGIADFLMYQADATAKIISIGDVNTAGGGARFQLDDANKKYSFTNGTIYAAGYGGTTPVPIDAGQLAKYVLATSSNGKFYEVDAKSFSVINATTGSATAPSLNSTLTVVGAGGITTSIAGQTLTITGSGGGSAFPYWSTINLTAASGTSGTVTGDPNVIPNTVGANTLNLIAGDNIILNGADASNRIRIDAVVPTAGVSIGTVNLTASGTGTVTGQTSIIANAPSGTLGLIAGNGITLGGNSLTDTITIASTLGFTSLVGAAGGNISVSVNSTTGVGTITGPNIWRTIAVPTPGTGQPAQTSFTPDVALDTLNFAAGPGITLATTPASGTLTISATAATPTNSWFTIAAGNQTITPDAAQDTLTFVGGTGIGVTVSDTLANPDRVTITNTGVTALTVGATPLTGGVTLVGTGGTTVTSSGSTITINSTGGTATTVDAGQGLTKNTAITPNVIELGSSNSGLPATITNNRYIGTGTNSIQITGSPGAGSANMQITSSTVGRAIRAINSAASSSEGAIYASAAMGTSVDSDPTGTIYAQSTGIGHAIVGVSSTATNGIAGVFGSGIQGVKGYTGTASGIGVLGESLNTTLGVGVRGIAQGQYTLNPNSNTSWAGWFSVTASDNINKVEVLRLDRSTSNGGGTATDDFGGTIGFYLENNNSLLIRAGQVGYTWGKSFTGDSRFKVSVLKSSSAVGPAVPEKVRLEVRETGQILFSSYTGINRLFPPPSFPFEADKGSFPPTQGTNDLPTNTNYNTATIYDHVVLGAPCYPTETEAEGIIETLRTTGGRFSPTITASPSLTGTSANIRSAVFSRTNNIVHVAMVIQCNSVTTTFSNLQGFVIYLPVFADNNFIAESDVIGTVTSRLNVSGQVTAQGRFDNLRVEAVPGTNNTCRIAFTCAQVQNAGLTNEFSVTLMYNLY